ncbi:receptor-like protein kinase BRI1-like 3 [Rhododendron vialii]|uniref:receptor-like protein kinase BRI1-like 3 n=1 Tax=Rhododendron vialii TaxID=182163 RepID=UPI0026600380|nr:receptor-like protein kinase BRI1-like 3 [Rhododendron vialii]
MSLFCFSLSTTIHSSLDLSELNKPGSHPHLSRRLGRDDDALHRMRRLQEKSQQNPDHSAPAAAELSSTFNPKQVSMAELLEPTDNFSPDLIIGHGSFGSVYKARLPYPGLSTVAVKKLSPTPSRTSASSGPRWKS